MSQTQKVAANKSEIVAKLPKACSDETAAVEFLEEQRWGNAPTCPRCESSDVRKILAEDGSRGTRYLWRCYGCKKQYTVRVGTIMEDSKIPFRHWCYAFWAACASKKGVSSLQIQRMTGLTYKSALFMMHRVRWAMAPVEGTEQKLSGVVEFDETYVGGKPRHRAEMLNFGGGEKRRRLGPAADFKDRKTPVLAGVERNGRVRVRVATDVNGATLADHVSDMVNTSAHLMTDEHQGYKRIGRGFAKHDTVNHSEGEYARGQVTTNRIEGFFANLKRQIIGTHHAVSRKHLHRYVNESAFKYNTRSVDDGERTRQAIKNAFGKRLTYNDQVDG